MHPALWLAMAISLIIIGVILLNGASSTAH